MPRPSMNTHASLSRAKRRTGRRSSPAIWLEIFPAAPLTFDSFSNSKGTRLRRWKSSHRRWSARLVGCVERRGGLRFNHLLPGNQHDSEASFVSHHPSVSFGSICKRNGFDHRADSLQGAEGKRVLRVYRRAGHGSRNRTHTEKKRNGVYLDWFISSGSGDNELAAWSKSSEKWRHRLTVCGGSHDQSGAAQGLQCGNRIHPGFSNYGSPIAVSDKNAWPIWLSEDALRGSHIFFKGRLRPLDNADVVAILDQN